MIKQKNLLLPPETCTNPIHTHAHIHTIYMVYAHTHTHTHTPHHSGHGEQVRVVAALLEVHHDVEQGHLVAPTLGVQGLKVPCEDELVVLPVEVRG